MMADRIHWTIGQARALFDKPLLELLFEAQTVHRQHFDRVRCRSTTRCRSRPALARKTANTTRSSRYKTGLESGG